MAAPRSTPERPSGRERRAHIRVDVLGQIGAHYVARPRPLSLLEISAGGFSLEATTPFEPGTVHKFRLSTNDGGGRSVVLNAKAMHSTLTSATGGLPIYVVGFQLVDIEDQAATEFASLLDEAASLWRAG